MQVAKNISELIGRTPLLELSRFAGGLPARVLGKLECMNPAGSVKDRVAKNMIDDAEARGVLKKGATIIEPTSGNTGIGLAAIAASRGYRVILTMPDSMSIERRNLLSAYGAEIVLTPGKDGMSGAIARAEALGREIDGAFLPRQFENPANPASHKTTADEIWEDTAGRVDIFIATVGTGGTLSGTAKYLRQKNPNLYVVAVEPAGSPVLSGGSAGAHKIQGIGAGFVPKTLDTSAYNEIIAVSDEDALMSGNEIAKREGVLVGISSGAAAFAARKVASREENRGKTIVAILPDTGERYLSTEMYK
ncbi:MAG: cysteine synthase A [Ruminococcaceae bacterium]|nr:cysteine synthase A [Oscillospiraceae bacterium]